MTRTFTCNLLWHGSFTWNLLWEGHLPVIFFDEGPLPAIFSEEGPLPVIFSDENSLPWIFSDDGGLLPGIFYGESPLPGIVSDENPLPGIFSEMVFTWNLLWDSLLPGIFSEMVFYLESSTRRILYLESPGRMERSPLLHLSLTGSQVAQPPLSRCLANCCRSAWAGKFSTRLSSYTCSTRCQCFLLQSVGGGGGICR